MTISKEERQRITLYTKNLKNVLQERYRQKFRVHTSQSLRPNPFIEVRVNNWETEIMPNDLRVIAVKIAYGENSNVSNWDDVNYGNIRRGGITLSYSQWSKIVG